MEWCIVTRVFLYTAYHAQGQWLLSRLQCGLRVHPKEKSILSSPPTNTLCQHCTDVYAVILFWQCSLPSCSYSYVPTQPTNFSFPPIRQSQLFLRSIMHPHQSITNFFSFSLLPRKKKQQSGPQPAALQISAKPAGTEITKSTKFHPKRWRFSFTGPGGPAPPVPGHDRGRRGRQRPQRGLRPAAPVLVALQALPGLPGGGGEPNHGHRLIRENILTAVHS